MSRRLKAMSNADLVIEFHRLSIRSGNHFAVVPMMDKDYRRMADIQAEILRRLDLVPQTRKQGGKK